MRNTAGQATDHLQLLRLEQRPPRRSQRLFGHPLRAGVADHHRKADEAALVVLNEIDHILNRDVITIFTNVPAGVKEPAIAPGRRQNGLRLAPVPPVWREQPGKRSPDHVQGGKAQHLFEAAAPAGDPAHLIKLADRVIVKALGQLRNTLGVAARGIFDVVAAGVVAADNDEAALAGSAFPELLNRQMRPEPSSVPALAPAVVFETPHRPAF
nr:hypothetical protein [Jiella flava]